MRKDLSTEEQAKARFEFRTFGQNFDLAAKRMARLSMPVPEEFWESNSNEIYIVSPSNDNNNIKIRNGKIDIKTYVQTVDGLEQWAPSTKADFPLSVDFLTNVVFPALRVTLPHLDQEVYTCDQFIDLIGKQADIRAVRVQKKRFEYQVNKTICEIASVLINGAKVLTISSESTEIEELKNAIKEIGLEGLENINYLQAIKRIIGMSNKPLAN